MARSRKTYTPEFKLQAVKMILEQKLSVAEVARRLGVGENLLHTWKKAVLKDAAKAFPGSGHLTQRPSGPRGRPTTPPRSSGGRVGTRARRSRSSAPGAGRRFSFGSG